MSGTTLPAGVERSILAGVFLLPLVCWPGADHSFSTPKLCLIAAVGLAVSLRPSCLRAPAWPWLLWLGALGLSAALAPSASFQALAIGVAPLVLFPAAGLVRPKPLINALVWASLIESSIVLLQFAGLDPFRIAGWRPELFDSSRMRAYGTLGNPNFAAAWLCATLPLTLEEGRGRAFRTVAFAIQTAAILAAGSRVFLLALPVMALVLLPRRKWLAVLPLAAAVLWLSPARSLGTTVEGRFYLARVTSAHLVDVPPAGFGPGAFPLRFGSWEIEWFRTRGAQHASARFAGPADHPHNDYLEFWVEYGPVGLLAFLLLCGWLARRIGLPRPENAGVWSGAAILLLIALVDFPFHRPAEWGLFWLYLGILSQGEICNVDEEARVRGGSADARLRPVPRRQVPFPG